MDQNNRGVAILRMLALPFLQLKLFLHRQQLNYFESALINP